jgi:16S rRNA (guanine966-N2)-methyltransferase
VRIIGGKFGGHRLKAPKGLDTRPTLDPHKETLFNILDHSLNLEFGGVLDLFAGSGSLGFEALSRGASFVVFVENSDAAIETIRENANSLKLQEDQDFFIIAEKNLSKWKAELARFQKNYIQGQTFSHFFCDPPYGKNWGQKAFEALNAPRENTQLFSVEALWIQESAKEDPLLVIKKFQNWSLKKIKEMGGTRIEFFHYIQG